jgi:hypothetical protein
MSKDVRYTAVKHLMGVDTILNIKGVFDYIPKTVVSKDLGMNYQTFTRKVEDPRLFTVQEILMMAELLGVTPEALFTLISNSIVKKKGK